MGIPEANIRGTFEAGSEPGTAVMDVPVQAFTDDEGERRTDAEFRALKGREKPYKVSFGRGGYMLVKPNGAKYWRLKYYFGGTEQSPYAIGVYPEVSLAEARRERDKARAWLRDGFDPKLKREAEKQSNRADQQLTCKAIAEEWFSEKSPGWSKSYRNTVRNRLDDYIYPYIGSLPIRDVQAVNVADVLERINKRGTQEVVAKVRVILSQVFRHAVVPAGLTSNPVDLLKGRFQRTKAVVHRRRVPPADMPALFESITKAPAEGVTKLALYFVILTCARTGEMRFSTWKEVESAKGGKIWRLSAERMKMDREHVVPLSRQALQVLELVKPMRTSEDTDALIFPGFTRHGSLSENALLALLSRAGYFGRQTTHGFRGAFSTWAHEVAEANPDVIELCLAHVQGGVRGDYNDAQYIPQRRALLQQWAAQCEAWGMKIAEAAA